MATDHMLVVSPHVHIAKDLTLFKVAMADVIRNLDELILAAWSRTEQMSGVDMIHPSAPIGSVALHLTAEVGARSLLARWRSKKAR